MFVHETIRIMKVDYTAIELMTLHRKYLITLRESTQTDRRVAGESRHTFEYALIINCMSG